MKAKQLITALLLLFVAASVAVLATRGLRQTDSEATASNGSAATTSAQNAFHPPADGIVAYYFHGTTRCPTCRKIEAYAHEALEASKDEGNRGGQVVWTVLNYEAPENAHYAKEFEIIAPTVVLVRMEHGQQKDFKNLMRVWELVGDKPAFFDYIRGELKDLAT